MDNKKRKSILQTQSSKEDGNTESRPKRVSFYSKKSVREFNFEEGGWQGDYELSTNNSSLKSNSANSQTKLNASLALCTTNEFINKSDQDTVCIENTLDLTLFDSETNLAKTTFKMQPKEKTNILETLEIPKEKSLSKSNNKETELKNTVSSNEDNKSDGKFIFFNENSNKENIMPTPVDILTLADSITKPNSDETLKGQQTLLSDSDEFFEIRSFHQDLQRISEHVEQQHIKKIQQTIIEEPKTEKVENKSPGNVFPTTKSSKVFVRHITTPLRLVEKVHEQNLKRAQQQPQIEKDIGRKSLNNILSDVSGISPISDSPASFRMETSSADTSLLPPEYLASNHKKRINLQQLNADMAKGKIKLFPNVETRSVYQTKFATPLNINKTKKNAIDIELENTFWHTNQNEKNTENIEIIAMDNSNLQINNAENPKNRKTIFYDDSGEILQNEIPNHKSHIVSRSLFQTDDCEITENVMSTKSKETKKCSTEIENDILLSSKSNDNNVLVPVEETINTNINPESFYSKKIPLRRTIFFENESIETYTQSKPKTLDQGYIEKMNEDFISDFQDEDDDLLKAIQREKNKTIIFENEQTMNIAEQTHIISIKETFEIKNIIEENVVKQFPKPRRDTQHFNESILPEDNGDVDVRNLEVHTKGTAIPKLKFLAYDQNKTMDMDTTAAIVSETNDAIPKPIFLTDQKNEILDMETATEILPKTTITTINSVGQNGTLDMETTAVIISEANESFSVDNRNETQDMETTLTVSPKDNKNEILDMEVTAAIITKDSDSIPKLKFLKDQSNETMDMNPLINDPVPKVLSDKQNETMDMETTLTLTTTEENETIPKPRFLTDQRNNTLMTQETIFNIPEHNINETVDIEIKSPMNSKYTGTIPKRKSLIVNKNETLDMEIKNFSLKQNENTTIKTKSKILKTQKSVVFSAVPDRFEVLMTPVTSFKTKRPIASYAFSPATPHRSLLEFEELEKMIKNDSSIKESPKENRTKFFDSPVEEIDMGCESIFEFKKKTMKRDTANITPNLPNSKKRQSCLTSNDDICTKNRMTKLFTEPMDLENNYVEEPEMPIMENTLFNNKNHSDEEVIDRTEPPSCLEYTEETLCASNDNDNNQVLQQTLQTTTTTPIATTPSRIPIYAGTKRKSMARLSSPNMQSLQNLDFFDTIEMGRLATTDCNLDLTNKPCFLEKDDDAPITISDVSQHYLSLKKKEIVNIEEDNDDVESSKNFDADKSIAKIKDYLNIIEDPIRMQEIMDTMIDDDENKSKIICGDEVFELSFNFDADAAIAKMEAEVAEKISKENCNKQKALVCRKCVNCLDSILNETVSTTAGSANSTFVMPTFPPLSTLSSKLFTKLDRFKKEPTLAETANIIEQLELQRLQMGDIFKSSIDDDDDELKLDDDPRRYEKDYGNPYLIEYFARKKRNAEELKEFERNYVPVPITFVDQLEELMSEPTAQNWIINLEWQARNILRFFHRKFLSFMIIIQYEEVAHFGAEVKILSIQFSEKYIKTDWSPSDYISLFQLKLEFPRDLSTLCEGNTAKDVFEMFEKLDEKCLEVDRMANQLWYLAIRYDSQIIRENHRIFMQKMVRKAVEVNGYYHHTETTEFRIEIMHIRKLCFKNIIKPQLFLFKEDIDQLPMGLEFLESFLPDPASFLRNGNESR